MAKSHDDILINTWSKHKISNYAAIDQCRSPMDIKIYFHMRRNYWDVMLPKERQIWLAHWNVVALNNKRLKTETFTKWVYITKKIMERVEGYESIYNS